MPTRRIGVDVADFNMPIKSGLRLASELELRAVELSVSMGEISPRNLSTSGRRHLIRLVEGLGLQAVALRADFPSLSLTDPRTVDQRVSRTADVLELAADLGIPIVTAATGALTHPVEGEPSATALSALSSIGTAADARNVAYAIRPSRDSGDRVAKVLGELACPALKVCLDPAASVISGIDPMTIVEQLISETVLVHTRDATAGLIERSGEETRLGEGDVDLVGLLAALESSGFGGAYVLRRTVSSNPIADLRDARERLCQLLPPV